MALKKDQKEAIIKQYRKGEKDTGSVEVQVAIITTEINELTEHMKLHKQDKHSKLGLLKKVGKRRSLLDYLKEHNVVSYRDIIKKLNLRK